MSHTPAPWKIGFTTQKGTVIDPFDPTDNLGKNIALAFSETDARRIVACVNACEGIETEMLEIPGLLKSLVAARTQELRAEFKALKAVNEILKFENERLQAELSQKELDRSKEHSEWILGKWNEDAKAFDARRKTDAEKAKILLGKWEDVEQAHIEPKLEHAPWESLDPSMNFQAYDRDGWLVAYEVRPIMDLKNDEWIPDGECEGGEWIKLSKFKILNWQQTLIERPTQQDGPIEPDPSDLAHDHNAITYGADAPTEYDPS